MHHYTEGGAPGSAEQAAATMAALSGERCTILLADSHTLKQLDAMEITGGVCRNPGPSDLPPTLYN